MMDPTLIILAAGRARRYGGVKQLAPIGLQGEAVIDLIGSDAYDGGFGHIVFVINPDTGDQIREHVAQWWPPTCPVSFAIQDRPLGTVHAVLSAANAVDTHAPFAVANADDLYGREAMLALGTHLRTVQTNCLVGFRLDRALVGDQPVTRGVCQVRDGRLVAIVERHRVHKSADGFVADDGLQPRSLSPDTRVSMNLWGFESAMWTTFRHAMQSATSASEEAEVLLPTVVGTALQRGDVEFQVLEVASQCLGVTHAEDLPLVQASVRHQIERSERPAAVFSSSRRQTTKTPSD